MIVTSCRVYLSGTLRDIARAAAGLCRDVGQAAPDHRQPPRRAGPRAVLLPPLPVQPGGLPEGLRGWPVLPMPAPVEQRQSRSRTSPCPTRLQTIGRSWGWGSFVIISGSSVIIHFRNNTNPTQIIPFLQKQPVLVWGRHAVGWCGGLEKCAWRHRVKRAEVQLFSSTAEDKI